MANRKIEGTGNVTRAGFMERKRERERDGAKWKKAKEESDMCLSFSHPAIASCLFRNLFYFFYPFLFNPLLAKNLIYFSARKRAWR